MSVFKKLFGQKDDDGETPDFKAFVEGSMEGLRLQTEAHQGTWRLGKSERWDFSMDTGELVFTFPDMIVRGPAQIIGSFDSVEGSWMWAWANSSIAASLARDSVRIREYGEQHKIRRLTTRVGLRSRWMVGTWQQSPTDYARPTAFTVDLRARHLCLSLSARFRSARRHDAGKKSRCCESDHGALVAVHASRRPRRCASLGHFVP